MTKISTALVSIFLLVICQAATAVVETYEFETAEQRHQYTYLTETLRCPKCQNQNIEDSNAPIAQDMRREVQRLVSEGQSNDQVIDFMVDRFGDFVMYKPRLDISTALLWFGPLLLGLSGIIGVVLLARKSRSNSMQKDNGSATLTEAERKKIKSLLKD